MLITGVFALLATPALACTNPAGDEGEQVFNDTHNVMQFCDGTNWVRMDGDGDEIWNDGDNFIYYDSVPAAIGTNSMNPADQDLLIDGKSQAGSVMASPLNNNSTDYTIGANQEQLIQLYTQAEIDALTGLGAGTWVYNLDTNGLELWDGDEWIKINAVPLYIGPSGQYQIAATCKEILDNGDSTGDGQYTIDPDGAGNEDPFDVYCDMTTDGGGWTIFSAYTGANGEEPMVSDTEALSGDPLAFDHYNINRAKKIAINALSSETIFVSNAPAWLKASAAPFSNDLDTPNTKYTVNVTLTADDATTQSDGLMGYVNYDYTHGGDFGVTTQTHGFDENSSNHRFLNTSCNPMYIYSSSTASSDSDAGYDVNTALGSWATTNSCQTAEGGSLVFYAGMR